MQHHAELLYEVTTELPAVDHAGLLGDNTPSNLVRNVRASHSPYVSIMLVSMGLPTAMTATRVNDSWSREILNCYAEAKELKSDESTNCAIDVPGQVLS